MVVGGPVMRELRYLTRIPHKNVIIFLPLILFRNTSGGIHNNQSQVALLKMAPNLAFSEVPPCPPSCYSITLSRLPLDLHIIAPSLLSSKLQPDSSPFSNNFGASDITVISLIHLKFLGTWTNSQKPLVPGFFSGSGDKVFIALLIILYHTVLPNRVEPLCPPFLQSNRTTCTFEQTQDDFQIFQGQVL